MTGCARGFTSSAPRRKRVAEGAGQKALMGALGELLPQAPMGAETPEVRCSKKSRGVKEVEAPLIGAHIGSPRLRHNSARNTMRVNAQARRRGSHTALEGSLGSVLAQDEEGTQRNDSFGGRANSCGVGSLVQVRSVHLAYQRRLSGGQSEMRGVKALRMGSSAQGPGLVMSFFMSGPRKTRPVHRLQ